MPISFRSPKDTASTERLLQNEPLLKPPVTTHGGEDTPFKPHDEDDLTPSAKDGTQHTHVRPVATVGRSYHQSDQDIPAARRRRRRFQKSNQWRMSLRKFRSVPLLQPRFELGDVELLTAVVSQPPMPLWTIPPKAGATRGLASVIPVANSVNKNLAPYPRTQATSPAMITLRRATTIRPPRRLSLTFFPPPKLSQASSGFPWSVIETLREFNGNIKTIRESPRAATEVRPWRAGLEPSGTNDARHSRASIASMVCTELIPSQSGGIGLGVNQSIDSPLRQCTRFTSDKGVYEILWDAETSQDALGGLSKYHNEFKSSTGRRHSLAIDELEMQLFKAREKSRRNSSRETTVDASSLENDSLDNRDGLSQAPLHGLLQVKLAKFTHNDQLRNLPRSKASRKVQVQTPLPTRPDVAGVMTTSTLKPFILHDNAGPITSVRDMGSEVSGGNMEECPELPVGSCVKNVQHLCVSPSTCTQYPLLLHNSSNLTGSAGLATHDLGHLKDEETQKSKDTIGWVVAGDDQNGTKKKVIRSCNK
ncbi:hypothetical protein B0A52_09535 [Exophiala mesophila]|uniref:Uncharacterized protein n=1 Tax=Exophiala mesophila TaxID=212818 RepID=A0A438MSR5_EXOME|nr:hypothetical protein B0A52_09535 [Exophiala mesophila]